MFTRSQFDSFLRLRRTESTLAAIGRELGVSRQAVYAWLKGTADPSNTVLILAERLMKEEEGKFDGRAGRETD